MYPAQQREQGVERPARGAHGYKSPGGGEPYLTAGCGRGAVYVLRLTKGRGVTEVSRRHSLPVYM